MAKEQAPVSPPVIAATISTCLIARHGLRDAIYIAECVYNQIKASVDQQKRLHPEDWMVQPLQPDNIVTIKVPPIPTI